MQDPCSTGPQHRKHALDHADYTGAIRQRELDHTDHDLSALKDLNHEGGVDDLSEVWNLSFGDVM